VSGENVEVAVSQLAPAEPVVADTGERFIHFQGRDIPRGTEIILEFSGLSGDTASLIWLLWVGIGVVVAVVIIYIIIRKKKAVADG
jgi:LPXTG-motif cell wall-anchored protein